jgi:hypothetical protein
MQAQRRQFALASLMALALLSMAGIAAAAHNEATALTGTVVSVNRDLNYVTIRDDVTGRTFKVDTRAMNGRQSIDVWNLRAGDRISSTGAWENSETYRADRVMFANRNPHAANRMSNGVSGTVEEVNRDLNYIIIRDQVTGQPVKVDVRKMDTRRSINVWQLRSGDIVTTQGKWTKNNRLFRADFVNFGNTLPMASGYNGGYSSPNMLSGTVESVNRELNYFMLRSDVTGQPVKIDVRQMDTRRSVNVWNLRAGDRITVDGSWNPEHDRFTAEMVRF